MSLLENKVLPAPIGMASSMEGAGAPDNLCRFLEGAWPARLGLQRMRPIPRKLTQIIPVHTGEQIQGYAFYQGRDLTDFVGDLLVFTDRNLYILPVFTENSGPEHPAYFYTQYNQTNRGQTFRIAQSTDISGLTTHQFQDAPYNFNTVSDWPSGGWPAGTLNNICAVQFDNELLFTAPGTSVDPAFGASPYTGNGLWRYYREYTGSGIFTQHLYAAYIPAGGAPSILAHIHPIVTGNYLTGVYEYAWTWVDELGRESSPSDSVTTPTLTNESVLIQRGSTAPLTATAPLAGWNLYRLNPGATVYYRLNASPIPVGTLTYTDLAYDPTITGNPVMPDPGENDPSDTCTYLTVHKGRVAMNSLFDYGVVQLSDAGSATQFSSITLPTNTSAGIRLEQQQTVTDSIRIPPRLPAPNPSPLPTNL